MKNTKKIGFIKFFIFYFKAVNCEFPDKTLEPKEPPKIYVRFSIPIDKKFHKQLMLFVYPFVCLFQLYCFIYCCNFFQFQELFQFSPFEHVSVFIAPFMLEIGWVISVRVSIPKVFIIWILSCRKNTNILFWILSGHFHTGKQVGLVRDLTGVQKKVQFLRKYFAQNDLIKIDDKITIGCIFSELFFTSDLIYGFINNKPIKIKFKGKNVKIYFKDEISVIKDTFNSPDELLNAVIEKLTQLKELDLIENPPLPPQNNSKKRKNKGKKKRK